MKQELKGAFLRGTLVLGGILSAIVATPVLFAAGADYPPTGGPVEPPGQDQSPPPDKEPAKNPVQKISLDVKGMNSKLDAEKIQKELKGKMGIISTRCDPAGGKCKVEIDPTKVKKEDVAVQMNRLGYHAFLMN